MAVFKFEGEIEGITETQLELVENVLQKQGFLDGKVIVEPVGKKGDNYIAQVLRFVYEKRDGTFFKMIFKVAPTAEHIRKMMNAGFLFRNEITMYEEVFPKFIDLQNQARVPANERIRFPVCYGALREAPHETILLEDLNEAGFEMLDKTKTLSDNTVRLTLKGLAIYHSLSYALKDKEPEAYKQLVSKLFNTWIHMDENPSMSMIFDMIENEVKPLMESEKHKKAIAGAFSQIPVIGRKLQPYEQTSKYSVIHQGDCWSNNIMFRQEDGKMVENVMIDYQMSKESHPAADILYLILTCSDYALRAKYFHEWIDYYHKALNDALANYGLNSNCIYPKDQLEADLRRYGKMMVAYGVLIATATVKKSEDIIDIKELTNIGTNGEAKDEFLSEISSKPLDVSTVLKLKQKVVGLMESGFELNLL